MGEVEGMPDAIVTARIEVIGYIDPASGEQAYQVHADCDVPLSTSIGLLELAKDDLIRRTENDPA